MKHEQSKHERSMFCPIDPVVLGFVKDEVVEGGKHVAAENKNGNKSKLSVDNETDPAQRSHLAKGHKQLEESKPAWSPKCASIPGESSSLF